MLKLNRGLLCTAAVTYLLLANLGSVVINPFKDAATVAILTIVFVIAYGVYMGAVNLLLCVGWGLEYFLQRPVAQNNRLTAYNLFFWLFVLLPPVGLVAVAYGIYLT